MAGGGSHPADVSARASIASELMILAELHGCKSSFGRAAFFPSALRQGVRIQGQRGPLIVSRR